VANTLWMIIEN